MLINVDKEKNKGMGVKPSLAYGRGNIRKIQSTVKSRWKEGKKEGTGAHWVLRGLRYGNRE